MVVNEHARGQISSQHLSVACFSVGIKWEYTLVAATLSI